VRLVAWFRRRWSVSDGPALGTLREEGFVAIDLETTGLDPRRDRIVSCAAVPFVDGVVGEAFVTLVDPGLPIPPSATAVHGITDAMVAGAPGVERVLDALDGRLRDHVVAGHGVAFDVAILDRERRLRGLPPLPNPALDTRGLAAALHPEWPDYELESVAARLGVDVVGRHTAEGDALTAGRVLLSLLPGLDARGIRTVGDLLWFQRSARRF